MKIAVGAIFATVLVATPVLAATAQKATPKPATPAVAPASLDERLGCGVMLVTIDEVLQRNPELAAKFAKGDSSSAAMMPMFRLLGVSGGIMLDQAYAEGATQGLTPTVLYRRGVANLSSQFANGADKDVAIAAFSRCMQVAAPES